MSGKERSPRHRPWSVYRANTFDLSSEMMGLALSGNPVTATMVTCILMISLGRYTEVLLFLSALQETARIRTSRCWSSALVSLMRFGMMGWLNGFESLKKFWNAKIKQAVGLVTESIAKKNLDVIGRKENERGNISG